jgi:hypothetical protein
MNKAKKSYRSRLLTSLLGSALLSFVIVQTTMAEDASGVRPEIAKPLQSAQQLIQGGKYAEALAKLKEADAVGEHSGYEDTVSNQLRFVAAQKAGEPALAVKAYDFLSTRPSVTAAQKQQYMLAIAGSYYSAKNYSESAQWASRYSAAGGPDPSAHTLLAQSYYLSNQLSNAIKAAAEAISIEEKQGRAPSESLLQIQASAANSAKDFDGYQIALEKLLNYYPKNDYWLDLIHLVTSKPGYSDRLSLDVLRLKVVTSTLKSASDYIDFIELALQAKFPAEAKTILDKGFAAGVLGTGTEAARHGRLRDMAKKSMDEDVKTLEARVSEAQAQKNGADLITLGLNYYGLGQYNKALTLIDQGQKMGGAKYPNEVKLHQGIITLASGQNAKAIDIFHSITGNDPTAKLARLWLLAASKR